MDSIFPPDRHSRMSSTIQVLQIPNPPTPEILDTEVESPFTRRRLSCADLSIDEAPSIDTKQLRALTQNASKLLRFARTVEASPSSPDLSVDEAPSIDTKQLRTLTQNASKLLHFVRTVEASPSSPVVLSAGPTVAAADAASKRAPSLKSTAPRAAFDDAIGGMNYLTRYPLSVASALSEPPLKGTAHEGAAVINDSFPVAALGVFNGFQFVGNVVETTIALKNVGATLGSARFRHDVRRADQESQNRLKAAHLEFKSGANDETSIHDFCVVAKEANAARSAKLDLKSTLRHLPERLIDAIRYTIVSWTSRTFSILKLGLRKVAWIGSASSVAGVVGSCFQAVSGLVKWRTSAQVVKNSKAWLQTTLAAKLSQSSEDFESQLLTQLVRHTCAQRSDALRKARDKRFKARIETMAGIVATVAAGLAFALPPAAFVSIGVGIAYAGYRAYKGIQGLLIARRGATKQDAQSALDRANSVDDQVRLTSIDPKATVRMVVELCGQGRNASLDDALVQLGIGPVDRDSFFSLAKIGDVSTASQMLERMLFDIGWAKVERPSSRFVVARDDDRGTGAPRPSITGTREPVAGGSLVRTSQTPTRKAVATTPADR